MDLVITINEKDLVNNPAIMDTVKALVLAVSGKTAPSAPVGIMPAAFTPVAPTMAPPVMQSPIPTAPTMAPQVMQSPVPTAPSVATNAMAALCGQNPIPTAAPTALPAVYTLEQLSLAAAPLMDAGKTDALVALMQSFGVQTLQQLPQERYNDFAVAIRGMGAQI
ncbi:MAG: hypothetical protein PHU31_02515 [Anaerotignum sp.]|nr:hypothetical protein [Anaerotignum sp.]